MPIKGSQEFPFRDGKTAFHSIMDYNEYALALIDLMLPDMNGMEIINAIRKVSTIPIIIITAKDNDTDKSLGLNLGADDYVVKPFSLIELAARIKANIRRARTYQPLPCDMAVKIKDLEIDPVSHTVRGFPLILRQRNLNYYIYWEPIRDRHFQKNVYTNSFGRNLISEMKMY